MLRCERMFATAPRPISDATGALGDAVEEVLALDGDDLTDDELRAAMIELRRAQSRLAAAVTELTATFDARRAWADDGSRNAADWLSFHAHRPRSEAASDAAFEELACRKQGFFKTRQRGIGLIDHKLLNMVVARTMNDPTPRR